MNYISKVLEVETVNLRIAFAESESDARSKAEELMLGFTIKPVYGNTSKLVRWTFLYLNKLEPKEGPFTYEVKVRAVSKTDYTVRASSLENAANKIQKIFYKKEESQKLPYRWTLLTTSVDV